MSLWRCSGEGPDSRTDDIFREDQGDPQRGNARRHPATEDERLWTINMGGCTGHLLAPEYMMTANHCSPRAGARYTSGYALGTGGRSDVTVAQVVEANAQLDYVILKITWTGTYPEAQKFPPLVATKASDVAVGAGATQGDELFTVGFPGDKSSTWGATYAEGRAKAVEDQLLVYNIGIINGNSGGGVWKKSDRMLVSLTNGGPHALGQAGWDTAGASDSANWNFGTAMWQIYAASRTLKDIFPGGRSRFTPQTSGEPPKAVWMLVAGDDTLFASAPAATAKLVWCESRDAGDCKDGAAGYTVATLDRTAGDMAIFKGRPAALRDGLVVTVLATDSAGKTVAQRTLQFKTR